MARPWAAAFLCLLLAAVTLGLYWPATSFDFVDVDDLDFVVGHRIVRQGLDLDTLRGAFAPHAGNWIPLTTLSLAADTSVHGPSPRGYHLTNVLLHALNSALLLWVLFRLTGHLWTSALATALLALHPMHVETVAWISERKGVLSTVFALLSLGCYGAWVHSRRRRWLAAAGCGLLLGLLSKPMLVTLPFVFLLLDHWPLRRDDAWRVRFVEKLPLFALIAVTSTITFLVQRAGGAVSSIQTLSLDDRFSNAIVSNVRYLGKFVWPTQLAYFYPYPSPGWPVLAVVGSLTIVAALTAAMVWWDRRYGRGHGLVGWLWFLGTLVPVIGIVQVGAQSLADRYTYVPYVGLGIVMAWTAREVATRRAGRFLTIGIAMILLTAAMLATRSELGHWRDSETLFRRALATTQDNAMAESGLGGYLGRTGRLNEALPHLQRAVQLNPSLGEAHVNLGIVYTIRGDAERALRHYRLAVQSRPGLPQAHANLAQALFKQGQIEEAAFHAQRAIELNPDDASLRALLQRLGSHRRD